MRNQFSFFILALSIVVTSCEYVEKEVSSSRQIPPQPSDSTDRVGTKERNVTNLTPYLVEDVPDSIDFEVIDFPCVMELGALKRDIESLRDEYGQEFETVSNDTERYLFAYGAVVEDQKIMLKSTELEYLKFVVHDDTMIVHTHKPQMPPLFWTFILFNGDEMPRIESDYVDVSADELFKYMRVDESL